MLDIHPDDVRVTICADDGRVVTSIPSWPDVAPCVEWIPVVDVDAPARPQFQSLAPAPAGRSLFSFIGWIVAAAVVVGLALAALENF